MAQQWRDRTGEDALICDIAIGENFSIVADVALQQAIWNVLDNGYEASGRPVRLIARRTDGDIVLIVQDDGPGFIEEILRDFGKPYRSTKGRQGGGLGMFLVINVMRKMGGAVTAENRPAGGAEVCLTLPIAAIARPERGQE